MLVNPNQVRRLERTIRNFFSKIAEPIDKPIVLRSTSSDSYGLLSTIRKVCESIRKKLMQFANDCGLINTVQRYEKRSSQDPLSDDWFSELLLQSIYVIRDLGNMINEIKSSTGLYLGEGNTTFRGSKVCANEKIERGILLVNCALRCIVNGVNNKDFCLSSNKLVNLYINI